MIKIKLNKKYIAPVTESEVLEEAIIDSVKKSHPGKEDLVDYFSSAGPNKIPGKDKYLAWIMRRHEEMDPEEIIDLIKQFDRYGATLKLTNPDINSYKTFEELKDALENVAVPTKELEKEGTMIVYQSPEKVKKEKFGKEIEVPHFEIIRPLNKQAACSVAGHRTAWCIAATKSTNYYNSYSKSGVIFYFIIDNSKPDKDPNQMFAYAMPSKKAAANSRDAMVRGALEIFNSEDVSVSREYVKKQIGSEREEEFYKIMGGEREREIPSTFIESPATFIKSIEKRLEAGNEKEDILENDLTSYLSDEFDFSTWDAPSMDFFKPDEYTQNKIKKINLFYEICLQSKYEFLKNYALSDINKLSSNSNFPLSNKILPLIHSISEKEVARMLPEEWDLYDLDNVLDYLNVVKISPKIFEQLLKIYKKLSDNELYTENEVTQLFNKILRQSSDKEMAKKSFNAVIEKYSDRLPESKKTIAGAVVNYFNNKAGISQELVPSIIKFIENNEDVEESFIDLGSNRYNFQFDLNNIKIFVDYANRAFNGLVTEKTALLLRNVLKSSYISKAQAKEMFFYIIYLFFPQKGVTEFLLNVLTNYISEDFNAEEKKSFQREIKEKISSNKSLIANNIKKIENAKQDILTILEKKYEEYEKNSTSPVMNEAIGKVQNIFTTRIEPSLRNVYITSTEIVESVLDLVNKLYDLDMEKSKGKRLLASFSASILENIYNTFGSEDIRTNILKTKTYNQLRTVEKLELLNSSLIHGKRNNLERKLGDEVYTETDNNIVDNLVQVGENFANEASDTKQFVMRSAKSILHYTNLFTSAGHSWEQREFLFGAKEKNISKAPVFKFLSFIDKFLEKFIPKNKVGVYDPKELKEEVKDLAGFIGAILHDFYKNYFMNSQNLNEKYNLEVIKQIKKFNLTDLEIEIGVLVSKQGYDLYSKNDEEEQLEEDYINEEIEYEQPKPFYFNGRTFVYRNR